MEFIVKSVNVLNKSKFNEGDKTENMNASIQVIGEINDIISVFIKSGIYWFEYNNGEKFYCLRNSAYEVIKECNRIINSNNKNIRGIAKNILNSLYV